jgi:type II secretory pathway pseudopilin PulG
MAAFSHLETVLVLAILGLLAVAGVGLLAPSPALTLAQGELRGALEQAYLLARARGGDVRVALQGSGSPGLLPLTLPLRLPRGVRWGLPPGGVPLPSGMDPTVAAHVTGQGHGVITVTPRRTALANVWFLHDGRDALCLRLSGTGQIQTLRWRHGPRRWARE